MLYSPSVGGRVLEFYSAGQISPPLAHILVGLLSLGIVYAIGFAIFHGVRARRRARAAAGAFDPAAILAPGHAFVAGVVELAEGQTGSAIDVEIDQVGTERKHKSSWSHKWTETDRRTRVSPFYIKRASGERVRVEPDLEVLLVDALDGMDWRQRTFRTRSAALTAGEQVVVEGWLDRGNDPEASPKPGRGYRDAPERGWVLKPRDGERLYVSTEPLAERHRARARQMFGAAVWGILFFAVSQIFLVTYYERVYLGAPRVASVLDRDHWTTRGSKGRTIHHYSVSVRLEDGEHFEDEVDRGVHDYVHIGDRSVVRWVESDHQACSFGKGSSVGFSNTFALLVLFGLSWWRAIAAYRKKPWYEAKVVQSGRGRLPMPASL